MGRLKQEAAESLLRLPDLDPDAEAVGIRARLQALSHQSALGDLAAGAVLEDYSASLLTHANPEIVRDCHTVLVAVALDRLQTAATTEPNEVIQKLEKLAMQTPVIDASSLLVMQRAMMILSQYGYTDATARTVEIIRQVASRITDPSLRKLAESIDASSRIAALESMRGAAMSGNPAGLEQWVQEVRRLAAQHPDLGSAQYLAGLNLQLEALGLIDICNATYEVMKDVFAKLEDREPMEVTLSAQTAFLKRQQSVGLAVPHSPASTLQGAAFRWEDFAGKNVVLIYWSIEQPDSLLSVAALEEFTASMQDQVQIVTVNIDRGAEALQRARKLAATMVWPCLSAYPADRADDSDPLVDSLGIISIPAVVIIDRNQKIAGVLLSQERVEEMLRRLVLP